MANTQYTPYPMTDWSSEISGGSSANGGFPMNPASGGSPAGVHASTTTTTTTTSSASAGPHMMAPGATTTTTNHTAAAPAAQAAQFPAAQMTRPPASAVSAAGNELSGSSGVLDLETHQPIEVIEAPASMNEAFLGSLKSMLLRNRGNFVTATFLIGTQGTTAWEGILHDVGNDYLIIFQPGRERYIACDIYSLKYIEFYDTRRRAMCEDVLRQNGMDNYV